MLTSQDLIMEGNQSLRAKCGLITLLDLLLGWQAKESKRINGIGAALLKDEKGNKINFEKGLSNLIMNGIT